jgi:hypothetical protein
MTSARTVCVMQPYLYPYAGYFRLLAAGDIFVLFDDVQFPRRGRVHRCEMSPGRWLTLPLARQSRDVLIRDLRFADGARASLDARLAAFEIPRRAASPASAVCEHLYGPLASVVDFLESGLRVVGRILGLRADVVRSSQFGVDSSLRGQARVIAVVRALGGRRYVNAPGGRALYDGAVFARAGVDLAFLAPYDGRFPQILPALLAGDVSALREDILATCRLAS